MEIGAYRKAVLPNGLRVLGVENPSLHSFVCSVYVHAGPRFESPPQVGLTHFLEHMLVQGSRDYPSSSDIMRGVEDLGGVINAGTYPEYLNAVFGVHRKHWQRVCEIASDVLLRPLLEEDEIEQEKRIVTEELAQHRDRVGRNVSSGELAYSLAFHRTVSEAGTRGTPGLMARFDRRRLHQHYRRFFVPANMVVCLAGGLDFAEVVGRMDEFFGAMEAGGDPPALPQPPSRDRGARAIYRATEVLPIVEVILSFPAYAFGDDRYDAARAVAQLLGGGLSSRLFSSVREDQGLTYDISAQLQGYSDAGLLEVTMAVGVDNLTEAFRATLKEVRAAADRGFDAEELSRYRERATCGMEMLTDQAGHLAEWFGRQELLLAPRPVTTPEQYIRRQKALTLGDLAASAADILDLEAADLVVVGPFEEQHRAALADLLPADQIEAEPVE